MKTFWTILAILFFLTAPFWYGYVIYSDLAHPEIWNEDWTHDPRIYLPVMAVVFPLIAWVWRREYLKAKQRREEELASIRRDLASDRAAREKQQAESNGNSGGDEPCATSD